MTLTQATAARVAAERDVYKATADDYDAALDRLREAQRLEREARAAEAAKEEW